MYVLQGIVRVNPVGIPIRASQELQYVLTNVAPDLIYDFNVRIKHEFPLEQHNNHFCYNVPIQVSAWNEAGYGRNASAVIYTAPAPGVSYI